MLSSGSFATSSLFSRFSGTFSSSTFVSSGFISVLSVLSSGSFATSSLFSRFSGTFSSSTFVSSGFISVLSFGSIFFGLSVSFDIIVLFLLLETMPDILLLEFSLSSLLILLFADVICGVVGIVCEVISAESVCLRLWTGIVESDFLAAGETKFSAVFAAFIVFEVANVFFCILFDAIFPKLLFPEEFFGELSCEEDNVAPCICAISGLCAAICGTLACLDLAIAFLICKYNLRCCWLCLLSLNAVLELSFTLPFT